MRDELILPKTVSCTPWGSNVGCEGNRAGIYKKRSMLPVLLRRRGLVESILPVLQIPPDSTSISPVFRGSISAVSRWSLRWSPGILEFEAVGECRIVVRSKLRPQHSCVLKSYTSIWLQRTGRTQSILQLLMGQKQEAQVLSP